MRVIETLHREHDAAGSVLDQLEEAVDTAVKGVPVSKDVFTDIAEFLTIFVGQWHHEMEESTVFCQFHDKTSQGLTQVLIREHVRGRALAKSYRKALGEYVHGSITSWR